MTTADSSSGVALPGLSASNPLGFLAALGVLRGITAARPSSDVRLAWASDVQWTPYLSGNGLDSQEELLDALCEFTRQRAGHRALEIGDDIKFSVDEYRHEVLAAALGRCTANERTEIDFLAAFASDVGDPNEAAPDTALRTMSGAGHQHFIATMRALADQTGRDHLAKTLFQRWRYDDPVKKSTLRWDPVDDVRYALRWRDPSGDPARTSRGAMWGANRLAFEALPLMSTAPRKYGVDTVGFQGKGARGTYWTWPVWRDGVEVDAVRSLLTLPELQQEQPERETLEARGIAEIYRSQRITVDKFRAFTPSWTP